MLHKVRRIITANDENGRARILSDAISPHEVESAPDRGLINLWGVGSYPPDMTDTDGAALVETLSPLRRWRHFSLLSVAGAKSR